MASVGPLTFITETKAESSLFLLENRRQGRSASFSASFGPRKSRGSAILGDSASLFSLCCRRKAGGGRKWSVKPVKAVGPDAGDCASGDEQEDAVQATIEKSKKVLAMQSDLLQQIAERRKLVSSIRNSTADIEKDENEKRSSNYRNMDPDSFGQGKIGGGRNGSTNPSSATRSTVNEVQENLVFPSAKSESATREQKKTSPLGEPSSSAAMDSLIESKSSSSGASWSESLPSWLSTTAKTSNLNDVEIENKASVPGIKEVKPDQVAKEQRNRSSVEQPSSKIGIATPEKSGRPRSGVDGYESLPSFLSTTAESSNVSDEAAEKGKEPHGEQTSDEPEKEEAKPPPLAGQNVMNIILVAAECAPFIKTGGLGDVAGSLPKALARRGHRVMVVVPRYNDYAEAKDTGVRKRYRADGQDMEVQYFQAYIDGVDFVFIESPIFRHMGSNIYGGNRLDILKRMVWFCKAAVEVPWHVPCGGVCYGDGNLVFIANDWHTALLPVYLKAFYRDHGLMKYTRSLLVIHNIAHQGRGPVEDFFCTDLPEHYIDMFKLNDPVGGEHFNIFAAGLKAADRIVTVSHGYAWELKTSEGGWGLHNIINENDWKLRGIVNGIDTREWSPQHDVYLQSDGYTNYSLETLHAGKPQCKSALQKELGLPVRPEVPLIGFIGRLDYQKGVDLIAEAVPWMMGQDAQLVMLGSGRPDLEQLLRQFESQYPDKARGWVGFSVKTAHRITAGADILLMPSRFEPCGLNQLYAMSYGTVPVVHAVGGLRDTVQPFNPYNESGLGWTFDSAETNKLIHALGNCLLTYKEYKRSWEGLQRRGMSQDLSWDHAAEKYEEVLVAAKYQW